jgi:hypothetical protein
MSSIAFAEDEWEFIGETKNMSIFFDKPTFNRTGADNYFVVLKYQLTNAGKDDYVRALYKAADNQADARQIRDLFKELSYFMRVIDLDTKNRTITTKTVMHYNVNNQVFYSFDSQDEKEPINPNTVSDKILKAVTAYAKQKNI